MRICIDLDGVITQLREPGQNYGELKPVPGAIEKLKQLKASGHYIIIFTARHMKTCNGNVGAVLARQGKATLDWLHRYQIPYDEITFGKPWADVYLDDNAHRFTGWEAINGDGSTFGLSAENRKMQSGKHSC